MRRSRPHSTTVEIGYSTRMALSPYIRKDVEREALRIF
jgi:hypothetical protein